MGTNGSAAGNIRGMDRHRATTSTGAVVDQPSALELADLVAEVDRSGRDAFLFVERHEADAGESYLQARRNRDGWVLELRDGGPARQYRAEVRDAAIVYSAVASWVLKARTRPELPWQRLGRPQAVGALAFRGLARAV